MKIKFILASILIIFSASNILAQTDNSEFQRDLSTLESQLAKQEKKLDEFYKELDKEYRTYKIIKKQFNSKYDIQDRTIDSLQKTINSNTANIKKTVSELGIKIDNLQQAVNLNSTNIKKTTNELGVKIEDTHKFANQSITDLNKIVSRNTLYWIIAILVVSLFVLLVFILLRKQIFKQKTDLDSNLQETRKVLEEEGIKLDNKLIEVLETQLKIINNSSNSDTEKEADHTLALKVADEIVRIEKNISKMDSSTKGIKPLVKGIERIKDNFKANGYEMVQLLNKEYDDGMNIDVINFIDDDTLPTGKKVITRIIKPQVNYNDILIQRAQVDVSQN